jgi:3-hydroxyisobutyrate dehydrogenase-like beta-hydroxyacid dehydrogenase
MTVSILTSSVGYPMARNLRAKIPAEDTLFVHDVNTAATQNFLEEHPQGVRVAGNVREVAEKAVCVLFSFLPSLMMN